MRVQLAALHLLDSETTEAAAAEPASEEARLRRELLAFGCGPFERLASLDLAALGALHASEMAAQAVERAEAEAIAALPSEAREMPAAVEGEVVAAAAVEGEVATAEEGAGPIGRSDGTSDVGGAHVAAESAAPPRLQRPPSAPLAPIRAVTPQPVVQ